MRFLFFTFELRSHKLLLRSWSTWSAPIYFKERKKTDSPREGWEDGTPPPHRDFKERSVVLAVAHPRASTTSYLSSQFLTNSRSDLHATSRFFSLSSSFSPLLFHPLTHRSPRPRSETPLPSALLSLLLSPLCVTPPSSRHNLAPGVYRAPLAQGPHF